MLSTNFNTIKLSKNILNNKFLKVKSSIQISLAFTMLFHPQILYGDTFTPNDKIFIEAEAIYNDKKSGNTIAKGNVIIVNEQKIMKADKAFYDQKSEKIYAEGNIAILNKDSEYYADEINHNLQNKTGEALNFKARIRKQDKLVARYAKDVNDTEKILNDAQFTKCNICSDNFIPNVPFWKIDAEQVIIDTKDETIIHKNARFSFHNIPFFYTPYLKTNFPNAKRKSGFLAPKFNRSDKFGFYTKIPYYINLAPHMDLVVKPVFMEKAHDVLESKFRYLTPWGQYNIAGSITKVTNPENNENTSKTRGHVFANGYFTYNGNDLGFDVEHVFATDKTYLKNYSYAEKDILTSHVFFKKFSTESFYTVETISFQDLRPSSDDKSFTGHVLPKVNYYVSHTLENGFMLYADSKFLNIHREKGVKQTRINSRIGVSKYFLASKNQIFKFDTSVKGSFYQTRFDTNSPFSLPTDFNNVEEGSRTFVDPRLRASWQMPISMQAGKHLSKIIEPIVIFNIKPTKEIKKTISNEDSIPAEISYSSIFSPNKLMGEDRIEKGSSIDYGINSHVDFFNYDLSLNYTIGQTYNFKKEEELNNTINSDKGFSDYVMYIAANYSDFLELGHLIRVDRKSKDIHLSDTELNLTYRGLKLDLDYLRFSRDNMKKIVTEREVFRKQLGVNTSYNITKNWLVGFETRTNVGKKIDNQKKRKIFDKYSLVYTNECIKMNFSIKNDYTNFKNLKPDTTYQFNIELPI